MRKTALALIAVAGIAAVMNAPTASAFGGSRSSFQFNNKSTNPENGNPTSAPSAGAPSTSVPEPGTLMLLAAGVTAIGGAALRRRRSKKD